MKNALLYTITIVTLLVTSRVESQTLFVPSGTSGIGNSTVTGNVGIGTTNPTTKLESAGAITINPSSANNNYLLFKTNGTSIGIIGSDRSIGGGYSNSLGMYVYGPNNLEFWTNSTKRFVITGGGNIGIGTSTPYYGRVEISQNSLGTQTVLAFSALDGTYNPRALINHVTSSNGHYVEFTSGYSTSCGYANWIFSYGNVGIGTTNTFGYKLAVNGTIGAKEVKVENTSAWPDFVFKANYQLRSLVDVEQFIKTNNHLPEIPTEAEVKKDGIGLGEMNTKLLQKVEELTLYVIEQNKRIEALENENKTQNKK